MPSLDAYLDDRDLTSPAGKGERPLFVVQKDDPWASIQRDARALPDLDVLEDLEAEA